MSDLKYAVYVVVVEDTERSDLHLAEISQSIIRLGGNMTSEKAEELSRDVDSTHWTNDEIAR